MPICERQHKSLFICEHCPAISEVALDKHPNNWTRKEEWVLCPECSKTYIICHNCGEIIPQKDMGLCGDQVSRKIDCPECNVNNIADPIPDQIEQTVDMLQKVIEKLKKEE